MLYEKLKKQAPGSDSQMLLQPITVTLNKEEYTAVLQALDTFCKSRFFRCRHDLGFSLRSAPLSMEHDDVSSAVYGNGRIFKSAKDRYYNRTLGLAVSQHCLQVSNQSGAKSSPQELLALVEQLEEDDPFGLSSWPSCESCNKEKRFRKTVWSSSVMFSISLFFLHNDMVGSTRSLTWKNKNYRKKSHLVVDCGTNCLRKKQIGGRTGPLAANGNCVSRFHANLPRNANWYSQTHCGGDGRHCAPSHRLCGIK